MPDLGAAALDYAARGWPVLPCEAAGPRVKAPISPLGVRAASTDPATVRTWWRAFPEAMIGIATGPTLGAFVIDIDAAGAGPAEHLAALVAAAGMPIVPRALAVTPSGGWHLYFAWPEAAPIPNLHAVIPHVDVRGANGYVIAPPSVPLGRPPYRWKIAPTAPLAPAPAGLLALLHRQAPARELAR